MPFRWFRVKRRCKKSSLRHQIPSSPQFGLTMSNCGSCDYFGDFYPVIFNKKPSYLARFLFIYPLFCFSLSFFSSSSSQRRKAVSSSASVSDNALSFASCYIMGLLERLRITNFSLKCGDFLFQFFQ